MHRSNALYSPPVKLQRLATAIFASFLLTTTAFAASGSVASGSGSTASGSTVESQELIKDRAARAKDLRARILKGKKAEAEFLVQRAAFRKKRAELRRDCRDDLRRANRDTKFSTLQRCYRSDLTLERDFFLDERMYLDALQDVTKSINAAAVDRVNLLVDALNTVLFAIDNNVYHEEADILEARTNLHTRYRVPTWNAVALVRADRALSMLAALIIDLDAAKLPASQDVRGCLTMNETSLRLLLEHGTANAADEATQILPKVVVCVQQLDALNQSGSGSSLGH